MRTALSVSFFFMLWLTACQPRLANDAAGDSVNDTMQKIHQPTLSLSRDGARAFIDRGPQGFTFLDLDTGSILLEASNQGGYRKLFFGSNGQLLALSEEGEAMAWLNGKWESRFEAAPGQTVLDMAGSRDGQHLLVLTADSQTEARLWVDGAWDFPLGRISNGTIEANRDLSLLSLFLEGENGQQALFYQPDFDRGAMTELGAIQGNAQLPCQAPAVRGSLSGILQGANLVLVDGNQNKVTVPGTPRDTWESSHQPWLMSRVEAHLEGGNKRTMIFSLNSANGQVTREKEIIVDGTQSSRFCLSKDGLLRRYWLDTNAELQGEEIPWG